MNALDQTLLQYGADLDWLRRFDEDHADLLPYATLVGARQSGDGDLAALLGVYEWQGNPLVFLVDGTALRDGNQLQKIRRRLALRGDAPYLGVVNPGQLVLHRIALDAVGPDHSQLEPSGLPVATHATFAYLGNQRPGLTTKRRWIADVVLKLLGDAINALIEQAQVSDPDAISLVGRALFTRFLADRNLLPESFLVGRSAKCLFDTVANTKTTCRWLDDTFNGDLLPYSAGLIERLPDRAFKELGDILHGTPGGQPQLDWKEDWAHLDFAHIPVGVLSQAYEHFQRRHTQGRQKREGGYYTPRPIADMMVRGAFHALQREGRAHTACVLDPAVGAGVFLLMAFRQLVAERWLHDGQRPDTQILRKILYKQIKGFDINEAGLRFAALGLYLLSIELDPHPEPVQKLAFEKDLRGHVLFKVGDEGGLGSLGVGVGEEHYGQYDLVIGNPPWSSSTGLKGWSEVVQQVTKIAEQRLPVDGPVPCLPNQVLDLPFVWRAMEWARPGGLIVFALHGRLLFLQGEGMPEARAALFSALNVTGVLNGADLCQTRVWSDIGAPFCLLYARNEMPPPGAGFRFLSPYREDVMNRSGAFRLDVGNSETVSVQQAVQRPEILKILFRGGPLGLEVYDRILRRRMGTLLGYWEGEDLVSGNGYQKLRASSRVRKTGDGLPGVPAEYLADLPELTAVAAKTLLVNLAPLLGFDKKRIHDHRPRELFLEPLLIVRESLPSQSGRIRVSVSDGSVVFNQTYHGYSARTHAEGALLVRYLALIVGSKPALWFALLTSGRLGSDRRILEKIIIDTIPVPAIDELPAAARNRITPLFDAVAQRDDEIAWGEVDAWVAELYGLRRRDLEIIDDILRFNLPFAANRNAAQRPPTSAERKSFLVALESELRPWTQRSGRPLSVSLPDPPLGAPWGLLCIDMATIPVSTPSNDWPKILQLADQLASSEALLVEPDGNRLWVARLEQARYWSCSAARLLARRIVWEHGDRLFGSETA